MTIDLEESGRRAGGNRWIEVRLFELTGAWVPTIAESEARLMLDRHSRHQVWRAAQWWDRLPVIPGVERADLCQAPSPAWVRALERLGATEGAPGRLGALYRVVLPRLHTRYLHHRAEADAVADGSTLRTLGILAADLASDWQEGESVLESLLGPAALEEMGAAMTSVEAALAV